VSERASVLEHLRFSKQGAKVQSKGLVHMLVYNVHAAETDA
jgi:hypothetical protein